MEIVVEIIVYFIFPRESQIIFRMCATLSQKWVMKYYEMSCFTLSVFFMESWFLCFPRELTHIVYITNGDY